MKPPTCIPTPAPQFTSGEAAEAQEYVAKLPDRIRKLAERANARKAKAKKVDVEFSWIFDRKLNI